MNAAVARGLYSAGWWIGAPFVALYLLWRSLRQREYRLHWAERFLGAGPVPSGTGPVIWLHAVSVGETHAAQPLIEMLAAEHPDARFVLTHMTPTGRAVGEAFARSMSGRLTVRYSPYEFGFALRRFLREVRPAIGIVMETEVWPNLLFAAREAGLPMMLVNARLSEKSLARARRLETLIREAARIFVRIVAQSDADRSRLAQLYAGPIDVAGNVKFDLAPSPGLIERGRSMRRDRPAIVLASSREGEEALLLGAIAKKIEPDPDFFPDLWVVPRHPQRFAEVAALIEACGIAVTRRSRLKEKSGAEAGTREAKLRAAGAASACKRETPPGSVFPGSIVLGDSMGEMAMYYALADVTIMGGSFLPFGSQNLIESCAVGTPVIIGPSTYNFAQAARDAVAAGAAIQVATMDEALRAATELLRDPARLARMSAAALAFAQAHRGATARTAAIIRQVIAATAPEAR